MSKSKLFKTRPHKRRPAGFTLLELVFAMTMFTFFMVIAFRTIINIVRIYESAGISRNNQQAARSIVEEISRQVNFSGSATQLPQVLGAFTNPALCLNLPTGNVVFFQAGTPNGTTFNSDSQYQSTLYEASGSTVSCVDSASLQASLSPTNSIPLTSAALNSNAANGSGTNMLYWQPGVITTTNTDASGTTRTTTSIELDMTISQRGAPVSGPQVSDVFASAITIHSAFYARGATN